MQILELIFCATLATSPYSCSEPKQSKRFEYPSNMLCWQAAQVIAASGLPSGTKLIGYKCLYGKMGFDK